MKHLKQLFPLLLFGGLTLTAQERPQEVDLLIQGAWVFDGTGKDSVQLDVGISGEKISFVGKAQEIKAKATLDARGRYLAPGFIDTHTHADRWIARAKDAKAGEVSSNALLPWLQQGVTTLFAGNDGFGSHKVAEKLAEFQEIGLGTNVYLFVGLGPVRRAVLGKVDVDPTEAQLKTMEGLVDRAMQEGAIGFSTGFLYLPQRFAETPEAIALAKVAAKYEGAVYDSHMRSEGKWLLKAIRETMEIGQQAGIPVHISHLKASGRDNWGRSKAAIALIDSARTQGMAITANQYPFEASMTSLRANTIPGWGQEGGLRAMVRRLKDPELSKKIKDNLNQRDADFAKNVVIVSKAEGFGDISGKTLEELSREWKIDVGELVVRLLIMEPGVSAITFSMSEEDIQNYMVQPWVMTGSDGGGAHPRTYATFTRILEHYVLDKKLFSMAWAIHRATGLTAETFNIRDRGLIEVGRYADLILFDPDKLRAESTFQEAEALSTGMEYVWVNGQLAISKGAYTGALPGKALKRAGGPQTTKTRNP